VLRQGVRRLALIYVAIVAATVVVSSVLGLLAGASLGRSIALGFYVSGALLLVGCFVVGARGPLRGVSGEGDTVQLIGAKHVRTATPDERSEASRTAILLFAIGLSFVILGAVFDPAHSAF
jgi:hypothetical protein